MRITGTTSYTTMRDALGANLSRIADLQTQLGTGRRINRASDDPVGASHGAALPLVRGRPGGVRPVRPTTR